MPYPIQHHDRRNYYARKLEYRNLVPRLRHARQPSRAPLQRAAKGRKRLRCAVDDMLVACIVVDVDCYATQRRDFACQLVEARVVLLFALVGLRHGCAAEVWCSFRGCRSMFPGLEGAGDAVDGFEVIER